MNLTLEKIQQRLMSSDDLKTHLYTLQTKMTSNGISPIL